MTETQRRFSRTSLLPGQRVALCLQYDGSDYAGWQAQDQLPELHTVQGEAERALAVVFDAPVRLHCAGRTDTGVHALAQWAHLDLPSPRSLKACVVGGNAQLPPSIRIVEALPVDTSFHARHSATARSYDYLVANTPVASPLLHRRALWVRDELDARSMERALMPLLGEQDFSAFRAAACQSRTPMRRLLHARVRRSGEFLQIRLTANAFLHHMVRNIVGSLLLVGRGERPESWLGELLAGRDRTRAGATVASHGLYLSAVAYPDRYRIPPAPRPPFLDDLSRD